MRLETGFLYSNLFSQHDSC